MDSRRWRLATSSGAAPRSSPKSSAAARSAARARREASSIPLPTSRTPIPLVFTHDAAHCASTHAAPQGHGAHRHEHGARGISKPALTKIGCKAVCYMADLMSPRLRAPRVRLAPLRAWTKLATSRSAHRGRRQRSPQHFCASPSALDAGRSRPRSSLGVPVGFVNVVEAKESYSRDACRPSSRGRKGSSTVAAAIMERAALPDPRAGGPDDGARIRAGAAHLRRHHRGAAFCAGNRASGSGIPPLPTRQPSTEASFWANFRASRCMRAGSTRPTWSASFPARAHRRRRHAPFASLAKRQHPAASLAVGATMPAPCAPGWALQASCRSRRSPARRAFSPRARVVRFSRRGKGLLPTRRRRFHGALLPCVLRARCYNGVST